MEITNIIQTIENFIETNLNEISLELFVGVILLLVGIVLSKIFDKPKNTNNLLNNINYNDKNWKDELEKILEIEETMKSHFPEYNDYLLIQYGSSVIADSKLPSDYDFIVLMLGFPDNPRAMHNKGTISDIADTDNKDHVDIVFRDYLSFLFASSAGMPYENSVVQEGKLVLGHEGYFQWLKNITKNNLFDRDFILRRFEDKVSIEKQEYYKCANEYKEYGKDIYYVIRSGYYYITSLLQLNRIKKMNKV